MTVCNNNNKWFKDFAGGLRNKDDLLGSYGPFDEKHLLVLVIRLVRLDMTDSCGLSQWREI